MKVKDCDKCRKAMAKAMTKDCDKCLKVMAKEQEKACLSCQYDMFSKTADDIGRAMAAACIAVFHRKGRTKKYIKEFYEELLFILSAPKVLGVELHAEEIKKTLSEKYDIDFDRIKIQTETKEECFRRYKIG
jgi:hypothetical protein